MAGKRIYDLAPSIGISYRIIPGKSKLANLRVYLRRFKQMDKYLNIVSFNIPYPANYGGVIDVYYKLEALRAWRRETHITLFRI